MTAFGAADRERVDAIVARAQSFNAGHFYHREDAGTVLWLCEQLREAERRAERMRVLHKAVLNWDITAHGQCLCPDCEAIYDALGGLDDTLAEGAAASEPNAGSASARAALAEAGE